MNLLYRKLMKVTIKKNKNKNATDLKKPIKKYNQ